MTTRLDPQILEYYEQGREADRCLVGRGQLERVRTQELIGRHLPTGRLAVLDVGGGPGVYATWLAEAGHDVHLLEPVPAHVEQARAVHPRVTAEVADARDLPADDATADVVLLLGPLYHLVEHADRLQALAEVRRVLRAGGLVFAAAISRFAALLDLLIHVDRLHEPGVMDVVESAVTTGVFHGADVGLFTTAYFHRPRELVAELKQAGLEQPEVFNIEGPGFLAPDFEAKWSDATHRDVLLRAARLVEQDPDLLATASHLLAVAQLP